MKIVKATIEKTGIKAPEYTPIGESTFVAAVCDDGSLVLVYMEEGHKALYLAFNSYETRKIRSALRKGIE